MTFIIGEDIGGGAHDDTFTLDTGTVLMALSALSAFRECRAGSRGEGEWDANEAPSEWLEMMLEGEGLVVRGGR